ncbi:MAG TPA: PTS transporter subunit EIIB [Intrasporangiaceae bacterium]|nr:PTS transporter subunit EIIB [Intrasporangiaceae bacterium]
MVCATRLRIVVADAAISRMAGASTWARLRT